MIDLYTFTTPNGRKASIMLEEVGLPYRVHRIDITKNEQFAPDFLKVSPNNKIPAIVDTDGPGGEPISVFESGAILIYLAEKTGSELLPDDRRARTAALEWLMFQMAGVGPMLGQANHFVRFAKEKVPYGIKRYTDEALRLFGVMDRRLGEASHLAGDACTIADIATYPWIVSSDMLELDTAGFANVAAWRRRMAERPAVQRGMSIP